VNLHRRDRRERDEERKSNGLRDGINVVFMSLSILAVRDK